MKLAEALIERAEIQKRNKQLVSRIKNIAKIQEGDVPAEKPDDLIAEYEINMMRFLELVKRINLTNSKTVFDAEMSIADAIAYRDYLGARIGTFRDICEYAAITYNRYSRNEIRFVSNINSVEIQSKIDLMSKEYREFDTKLQGLNWTVELL